MRRLARSENTNTEFELRVPSKVMGSHLSCVRAALPFSHYQNCRWDFFRVATFFRSLRAVADCLSDFPSVPPRRYQIPQVQHYPHVHEHTPNCLDHEERAEIVAQCV